MDKGAFVGREALARQKAAGAGRALVQIAVDAIDAAVARDQAVEHDGAAIGKVTSVAKGFTLGKALAFAYVATAFATDGRLVTIRTALGEAIDGAITTRALYDPDRTRVVTHAEHCFTTTHTGKALGTRRSPISGRRACPAP